MKKFSLETLSGIIQRRIRTKNRNSYSYKLFKNSKLLNKKILEEARELIKTKNKNQVIWEASDLFYFISVFLVKRQVNLKKVLLKLEERNKKPKKLIKSQKKRKPTSWQTQKQ